MKNKIFYVILLAAVLINLFLILTNRPYKRISSLTTLGMLYLFVTKKEGGKRG